jgi:ADP-ribose pyrophosphatase YjhB (NUDIX family)
VLAPPPAPPVRTADTLVTSGDEIVHTTVKTPGTTYAPPGVRSHWTIPGGAGKANELPVTTAARELREELGLVRPIGALFTVSHIPADPPMAEGLAFVFDGGIITDDGLAALKLTDGEIAEVALAPCRRPPSG